MRALKFLLVFATALVLAAAPVWPPVFAMPLEDSGARAEGALLLQGNGNGNGNGNDNDKGNANDNDNGNGNDNGNDNGNGNDNDNGNGNDNDNGNGNDNDGGVSPALPPPPAPAAAPANQVSATVRAGQAGGTQLFLPGGSVVVQVVSAAPLNRDVTLTLRPLTSGSVPATPGPLVGGLVFELVVEGGLPGEVNLSVGYDDPGGLNEANFVLGFFDGSRWIEAPKQARDAGANYVASSTAATGTYALYQR
jgi:hypothetical protein